MKSYKIEIEDRNAELHYKALRLKADLIFHCSSLEDYFRNYRQLIRVASNSRREKNSQFKNVCYVLFKLDLLIEDLKDIESRVEETNDSFLFRPLQLATPMRREYLFKDDNSHRLRGVIGYKRLGNIILPLNDDGKIPQILNGIKKEDRVSVTVSQPEYNIYPPVATIYDLEKI